MLEWIEKVRQKPEVTRMMIGNTIFFVCALLILAVWFWNLTGSFPYETLTSTENQAGSWLTGIQNTFMEFRTSLGEAKQSIIDAINASKTENYDLLQQQSNSNK